MPRLGFGENHLETGPEQQPRGLVMGCDRWLGRGVLGQDSIIAKVLLEELSPTLLSEC